MKRTGKLLFFVGLPLGPVGFAGVVLYMLSGGGLPIPGMDTANLVLSALIWILGSASFVVGMIMWIAAHSRASRSMPPHRPKARR